MKDNSILNMALRMWENGVFLSLVEAYDFAERMNRKEAEKDGSQ